MARSARPRPGSSIRTARTSRQLAGQLVGDRPGGVGAAVVRDGDPGAEGEALAQVAGQPPHARREITFLIPNRNHDVHLQNCHGHGGSATHAPPRLKRPYACAMSKAVASRPACRASESQALSYLFSVTLISDRIWRDARPAAGPRAGQDRRSLQPTPVAASAEVRPIPSAPAVGRARSRPDRAGTAARRWLDRPGLPGRPAEAPSRGAAGLPAPAGPAGRLDRPRRQGSAPCSARRAAGGVTRSWRRRTRGPGAGGQGRLVAWVSGRGAGDRRGGLAAVADAAGLVRGGASGDDAGDRGQLVRRWLEADGDRCLLVFDDVADPEAVRPFLPARGAARVIVTSQREPGLGTSVQVGAFSGRARRWRSCPGARAWRRPRPARWPASSATCRWRWPRPRR